MIERYVPHGGRGGKIEERLLIGTALQEFLIFWLDLRRGVASFRSLPSGAWLAF